MSEACDSFIQHAWKQELCANCMKPKDGHAGLPVPAKRAPVKAPKPLLSTPNQSPSRNGFNEKDTPSKQKPEARIKPTVAAKPGSPCREVLGNRAAAGSSVKPNVAPKVAVKPQQRDRGGEGGRDLPSGFESEGEINTIKRSPASSSGRTPADGAYDSVPEPKPVPPSDPNTHFYTDYDLNYKGLSGKPVPVGAGTHVRNKSLDRLKNDLEIPMPYNVVDVSTNPPLKDPDSPSGRSVSPSINGAKLQSGSPQGPRKGGSPQLQRNIRILEQGASKSPATQRRDNNQDANNYYEDVEDPDYVDAEDQTQQFQRNTPTRTSSQKSAVFEAKLSVIAQNLNLEKKGPSGKPEPSHDVTPPKPASPTTDTSSPAPGKREKKKNKEELKQEKQRKGSVGKSFFKKLFSRGGTDTEDEGGFDAVDGPDVGGNRTDDEKFNKISAPIPTAPPPAKIEVKTGAATETNEKESAKKVNRVESLKQTQPAMFGAELRQALAKTSKTAEKDITSSVEKLRETKRDEVKAHDDSFSELKGSPLFDRRAQMAEQSQTLDVQQATEPDKSSPTRKDLDKSTNLNTSSNESAVKRLSTFGKDRKSITIGDPVLQDTTAPVIRLTEGSQISQQATCDTNPPSPQPPKTGKCETEIETKPKIKAEAPPPPKPEISTIKRRPAPAAPPPPIPMTEYPSKRNSSCASPPVSPRPPAPPPPQPKYPAPEQPPQLPDKVTGQKINSFNLDTDMMGSYDSTPKRRVDVPPPPQSMDLPPPPLSPRAVPSPEPPPPPPPPKTVPPPPPTPPEVTAPRLPEKTRKRNSLSDTGGPASPEVYSKRLEISAPRLQRTSAVLDGAVDAGMGASMTGELTSPKSASPTTSPQSTLGNGNRKPRPRSEFSEGGSLRRKPDRAPPPPPAPPDRRLSSNDLSPTEDLMRKLSRSISEDTSRRTQTFPRDRQPPVGGTLDRHSQHISQYRVDRAKTLSEGVGCDIDSFNSAVFKHETITNLSNEIKELNTKFNTRKLPSPPKDVYFPPENDYESVHSDDGEEESDSNNQRTTTGNVVAELRERDRRERSMTPYEIIDGEDQDGFGFSNRKSGDINHAKDGNRQEMIPRPGSSLDQHHDVMTMPTEYMQPVPHDHSPKDECMTTNMMGSYPDQHMPNLQNQNYHPNIHHAEHQLTHQALPQSVQQAIPFVMNLSGSSLPDSMPIVYSDTNPDENLVEWRPKPIPRKASSPSSSSSSSYAYSYGEDGSEINPTAFAPGEGWKRLAHKHITVLEQIRAALDSMFIGAPVSPSNLRWDDFTLESFVPVYQNIGIAFYRAITERLPQKECLLMLSPCPLPTEVPAQSHLGLLHPNALFQDLVSALLFPDVTSDPRVYGQVGKVPTTVWAVPFASVCSFEEYCIGLRGLYATKLPIFHRHLCSAFQQALSAILYLLNRDCSLQCFSGEEILGVTPIGDQETFVVALPHHCHVCNESKTSEQLSLYLHQLILRLLDDQHLAQACGVSLSHSRFFRGLIQVAKVLSHTFTVPNLFKAQLMCEFLLWGPGENELQAILSTHNPQGALSVWLEIERARVIGKYAIEDFAAAKEDAHRVHFLVSLTDHTLWDTVQLLLQD